jgi:CDGSH-type Zn-finger protein
MKKVLLLAALFTSFYTFKGWSENNSTKIANKKEVKKSTKKRRKKVEMCQECGKPEHDCECDGHHEEKNDKNKIEKNRTEENDK